MCIDTHHYSVCIETHFMFALCYMDQRQLFTIDQTHSNKQQTSGCMSYPCAIVDNDLHQTRVTPGNVTYLILFSPIRLYSSVWRHCTFLSRFFLTIYRRFYIVVYKVLYIQLLVYVAPMQFLFYEAPWFWRNLFSFHYVQFHLYIVQNKNKAHMT